LSFWTIPVLSQTFYFVVSLHVKCLVYANRFSVTVIYISLLSSVVSYVTPTNKLLPTTPLGR